MERAEYRANPANRCYYCKHELYTHLVGDRARARASPSSPTAATPTTAATTGPGRQAAREFGVRSPLDDAGLTKDEIRELSRRAGLPTWDEPASACLSSRIPYFSEVTDEKLRMIERAEAVLRDLGFRVCRVRHHDTHRAARARARRDAARARAGRSPTTIDRELRALGYAARDDRSARLPPGQPERSAAAASRLSVGAQRDSAALAVLFLAAHLSLLPPTLEDIDSVNFALGVRDFDVARHQPHPPGYPVFIALGQGLDARSCDAAQPAHAASTGAGAARARSPARR